MHAADPLGLCSRYGSAVECPGEDHRSQDAARVLGKPSRCGTATAGLVCNRLACEVRPVSEDEVRGADELWVTSSTKEVLAVTTLDGTAVGTGKPGPVFRRVHQLYQEFKRTIMRQAA